MWIQEAIFIEQCKMAKHCMVDIADIMDMPESLVHKRVKEYRAGKYTALLNEALDRERKIRRMRKEGIAFRVIAKKLDVDTGTVRNVCNKCGID